MSTARWLSELGQKSSAPTADGRPATSQYLLRTAFPVVTLCLAALIIVMIFLAGIRRGMDHVAAYGPESEQTAISIALSESVYQLHLGYLGFASVKNKLMEIWDRGAKDSNDPMLITNNRDRDLLNRAITAAASLGPQIPGYIGDRTLITTLYDDIGYVDYVKVSFRLFGMRIESMYYMFFVLLSLSTLAFIWTFRDSITAQLVLLSTLFAFYIEVHTAIFIPDMPTFTGMRHSSSLALVPMWYFVFLVVQRRPMSLGNMVSTLIELVILILALRIRGSTTWTILFVIAVAFVAAFIPWRRQPRDTRTGMKLLRSTASWPVLFLIVGFLANSLYARVMLHPVYFTDDVLPYHGLWEAAVLGLWPAPALFTPGAAQLIREGSTDQGSYREAYDYLKRSHFLAPSEDPDIAPPGYVSPWTGTLKFRLHDDIMRRVFFGMALHHPLKIAWVYAWAKPWALYEAVRLVFFRTPDYKWFQLMVGAGVVVGALMVLSGALASERIDLALVLYAAAVVVSGAPNLWAYASFHTIADHLLVLLAFGPFLLGSAIAIVIYAAWQLLPAGTRMQSGLKNAPPRTPATS